MKDPAKRETLLTAIVLSLMVGGFLFGVYRPVQNACAETQRQIDEAEQTIRDIPHRLAELESLQGQLQERRDYLKQTALTIPPHADVPRILHEVSELARTAKLTVTRLEPMAAESMQSCRKIPFRLSFTGNFAGIAAFSQGVESRSRLFDIGECVLSVSEENRRQVVKGDVYFSVYANLADFSDFAENNASRNPPTADRGIR